MTKKEVQNTITDDRKFKATEEEFSNILKLLSPGTNLRAGIDGALKAGKGALIVVEKDNIYPIIDGGFRINTKFTAQKLIELTKMDGAIILSNDMKKISYANTLMTPNSKIKTLETGTRHKAGERTAKQIGTLVVAISERRKEISIFYKNIKYLLMPTEEILRKANERMQILEKQKELFDSHINKLNFFEIRNSVNLNQAINVIQKGRLIQKIEDGLKKYLIELGKEGTLLKMRLKELTKGIEKETDLVIKDYAMFNSKTAKTLIGDLTYEELLDDDHIAKVLGYEEGIPKSIEIKGWRILSKTSLMESEIAVLTNEVDSLGKFLYSNPEVYKKTLGNEKGQILQEELKKIKLGNI